MNQVVGHGGVSKACFVLCRKRHWMQLMSVTGKSFDMDPKTFNLGNMFEMQLHKYAEEIGKITNAAVKELTIESELKKLTDVWREQRFEVFKYMKVRDWQVAGICLLPSCLPLHVGKLSNEAANVIHKP
jgi:hypothetical protein